MVKWYTRGTAKEKCWTCLRNLHLGKEISDIINSHNISLINGINNLVKEVSNLQDELSVIRKERNVLLETVKNLNGEIRNLSANMPQTKPSPEKEVSNM